MSLRGLAVLSGVLVGLGCAGVAPLGVGQVKVEGGCLDRPTRDFGPDNFSEPQVFVKRGDRAADFELDDVDGTSHRLSDLLKESPVLVVNASYTCPVYQRMRPKLDRLHDRFRGAVRVVLVYGPEAHPKTDLSPYSGALWSKPEKFSHVDEPTTYGERVRHAKRLEGDSGILILVEPLDNPVWCTYGTAPNGAYLIRQDGSFEAVHDWFDPKTMVASIAALTGNKPRRK